MEADMMHDALRADVLASLIAVTDVEKRSVSDSVAEHATHIREMLAANSQLAQEDLKQSLTDVRPALDTYIGKAEEIVRIAQTDKAAAEAQMPVFLATFTDLEDRMSAVSDLIERNSDGAEQAATSEVARAKTIDIMLLAAAIVLGGLASWTLIRAIATGMAALVTAITQMARGELGEDFKGNTYDECGQLLSLLKSMDTKFCGIVATVRRGADTVAFAARELSGGNDDLSRRTQEQAAALEQTAASMEQMSATVKQNADNARAASQLAFGARNQADLGGKVVQQAVTAMGEINTSSRRIADIISVIDEIAFQTNLLALNAAVEAARAGEQGRGFAVVASEVRSLAQRSAGAAREIKVLISESVDKVKNGSDLVDQSGRTIAEIMESVRKVTDIVAEISAASAEQSTGIEQVNRAVSQMDAGVQQNAALVEEAAAASKSMEHQTQSLISEVSFFRVRNGAQQFAHSSQPMLTPTHDSAESGHYEEEPLAVAS
jgi:methyl-accepting chemotaxis protein